MVRYPRNEFTDPVFPYRRSKPAPRKRQGPGAKSVSSLRDIDLLFSPGSALPPKGRRTL